WSSDVCSSDLHGRVERSYACSSAVVGMFCGDGLLELFLRQPAGSILQNVVDGDFGLIMQFHKRTIGAAIRGDGVVRHPFTINMSVQVLGRLGYGCHASP